VTRCEQVDHGGQCVRISGHRGVHLWPQLVETDAQSSLSAAVEGVEKRLSHLAATTASNIQLAAMDRRLTELEQRLFPPEPHPAVHPTCTAKLTFSPRLTEGYGCVRPRGHGGDHKDDSGDNWNIRYA
jgi:hypothetical protein